MADNNDPLNQKMSMDEFMKKAMAGEFDETGGPEMEKIKTLINKLSNETVTIDGKEYPTTWKLTKEEVDSINEHADALEAIFHEKRIPALLIVQGQNIGGVGSFEKLASVPSKRAAAAMHHLVHFALAAIGSGSMVDSGALDDISAAVLAHMACVLRDAEAGKLKSYDFKKYTVNYLQILTTKCMKMLHELEQKELNDAK